VAPTPRSDRRHAHGKAAATYQGDVFINCPFDDDYRPLRDAIVFAALACRLRPRCALEASNAGQVRIDKIVGMIRDCRWGIHDISRTEPNANGLPRFNMPLELGLFLGAHRFGSPEQREKSCLVLDREPFRFQQFISDIAGQDVVAHGGQPTLAIVAVRDWLAAWLPEQARRLPGGLSIADRFGAFQRDLPRLCAALHRQPANLTFTDYCQAVSDWLTEADAAAGGA
jgi:hypothetical protein